MRSIEQCSRLAFEEAVLRREMPQVRFYNHSEDTYVEGRFGVAGALQEYVLRVVLEDNYPDSMPSLYVVSPHTLFLRDGGTINDLGCSHAFHTRANGPGGCVAICHGSADNWHASRTLVQVFIKGVLWLSAYQAHLETGRPLSEFMLSDGGFGETRPADFAYLTSSPWNVRL